MRRAYEELMKQRRRLEAEIEELSRAVQDPPQIVIPDQSHNAPTFVEPGALEEDQALARALQDSMIEIGTPSKPKIPPPFEEPLTSDFGVLGSPSFVGPYIHHMVPPFVNPFMEPITPPFVDPFMEPITPPYGSPFTKPITPPFVNPFMEPITPPFVEPITPPYDYGDPFIANPSVQNNNREEQWGWEPIPNIESEEEMLKRALWESEREAEMQRIAETKRREEEERKMRNEMKLQQELEFQDSLNIDRVREETLREEEERQIRLLEEQARIEKERQRRLLEEQARIEKEKQELEIKRKEREKAELERKKQELIRSQPPPEPDEKDPNSIRLVIQFPGDIRHERRFLNSHTFGDVRKFVNSKILEKNGLTFKEYNLVSYPRRMWEKQHDLVTLEESGFKKRELLRIEPV